MSKMMAAVLAGLLCVSLAQAKEAKPGEQAAAPTPKISESLIKKMRDCRAQAKAKKLQGDAHTIFVSRCLDGSDARPRIAALKKAEAARIRRENCIKSVIARQLKGEEAKQFLSKCEKGDKG